MSNGPVPPEKIAASQKAWDDVVPRDAVGFDTEYDELPLQPECPFTWPTDLRNFYLNGLQCTWDGVSAERMTREQLIAFVGFLDKLGRVDAPVQD